jgi:hypothetical protein
MHGNHGNMGTWEHDKRKESKKDKKTEIEYDKKIKRQK